MTNKHGGCHDCKSTDQKILNGVTNINTPGMGKAVCDKCLEKASDK